MVENLANLPAVKAEMSMAEVHKRVNANEEQQPRVVSVSLLLEWVVSKLVTVGLVVDLWVLLECHRVAVG